MRLNNEKSLLILIIGMVVSCLPLTGFSAPGKIMQGKMSASDLQTLKVEPVKEFIVEYVDQEFAEAANELDKNKPSLTAASAPQDLKARLKFIRDKKTAYREIKKQVLGSLIKPGFSIEHEYVHLPMSHIITKNIKDFEQLLKNPQVAAVYPVQKLTTQLTESMPLVGQPFVTDLGFLGEETSVAVLDTGVDYTKPIFGCTAPGIPSGCRVSHLIETAPRDGQLDDSNGHGTNVSSIVAQVAPGTNIIAFDVFAGPFAFNVHILEAINLAIEFQQEFNIVALNLSLGLSVNSYFDCRSWANTPFQRALAVGIIPVVASGNDGFTQGLSEPACAKEALSVGAVYDSSQIAADELPSCEDRGQGVVADQVTCFSNSSPSLDLLAPGASILASGIKMSGTSQATPHVAGAIAILKAQNAFPNDTPFDTYQKLKSSGIPVTDRRNNITRPRIDLKNLYELATGASVE